MSEIMSTPIEITAHTLLRELIRHQSMLDRDDAYPIADWNHYLTMTRLVARALRMSKSALIQTGIATHRLAGKYRLSYSIPALVWDAAVTIVIPLACQARLVDTELPQLQHRLGTNRSIYTGSEPPQLGFDGIWIVDPRAWLQHQLNLALPDRIPTIIDGADDLDSLAQELLTVTLDPTDWDRLRLSQSPSTWENIGHARIQLLETIWQRPDNPYNCYLLDPIERSIVESLIARFAPNLPPIWREFQAQLTGTEDRIVWATIDRTHGNFTLKIAPSNPSGQLAPIWHRNPLSSLPVP
jgi:ATP-dependent DNA helicase DinG